MNEEDTLEVLYYRSGILLFDATYVRTMLMVLAYHYIA